MLFFTNVIIVSLRSNINVGTAKNEKRINRHRGRLKISYNKIEQVEVVEKDAREISKEEEA